MIAPALTVTAAVVVLAVLAALAAARILRRDPLLRALRARQDDAPAPGYHRDGADERRQETTEVPIPAIR